MRQKVEVDEYLHKPVKPKLLRETVTRLLTGMPIEWKNLAQKALDAQGVSDQDTAAVTNILNSQLKPKKN